MIEHAYSTHLPPTRIPAPGEMYVYTVVQTLPDDRGLLERSWDRLLRRTPILEASADLFYRTVVSVSPWIVIYRDDDPADRDDDPRLFSTWRNSWSDYVIECKAVATRPLDAADLSALSGQNVTAITVRRESRLSHEGELDDAVSNVELPDDDDDDWDYEEEDRLPTIHPNRTIQ